MEEIGRRLEAARLAKGLTLQDVEDETRIRKKYLEALETWRLTDIPGDVFVKGFLRTYGNFLGLDGEALVEEYKRYQPGAAPAEGPAGSKVAAAAMREPRREVLARRESVASAAPPPEERERPLRPASEASRAPRERPPRRPAPPAPRQRGPAPTNFFLRRAVVALLFLVPLAVAGYWLWDQTTSRPEPPPVTRQQDPPAAPSPAPVQAPQPAPEPPKPTVTMSGPRGMNIDFAVSVSPVVVEIRGFREGYPWVQVFQDGKEAFQGKLSGPVTYTGREVSMVLGFGQGVDLVINGQTFPLPAGGAYNIKITGSP